MKTTIGKSHEEWNALAERVRDVFADYPDDAYEIQSNIDVGEPYAAIQEGVSFAIADHPHLLPKFPKELKQIGDSDPATYWELHMLSKYLH